MIKDLKFEDGISLASFLRANSSAIPEAAGYTYIYWPCTVKVLTGIVLINTPLFSVLMRAAPLSLEYFVCLHTHTWDFNNSSL